MELIQDVCEAEDTALMRLQDKFDKKSFKPSILVQLFSNTFGGDSEQQELLKQFIVQCRDEFIAEKKRLAEEKVGPNATNSCW
jgi:hypothetical protein